MPPGAERLVAGGVPQFAKLANYEQEGSLVVGQATVLKFVLALQRGDHGSETGPLAYVKCGGVGWAE